MAKIDIVVPCYNYGRFLPACVASVLSQSVSDLRVLIIDDGSSDDSISIAKKLARQDARVTLTSHSRNQGHISTYNEGIAWASADYFLLLSADDLLVAGAFQRAIEIMDRNPDVSLTYGKCTPWFDDFPHPKIDFQENYSWRKHDLIREICTIAVNVVPTPTAIARTSAQKTVGGYRPWLPHAGDMEMWLRLAANGSVAQIDAVQGIYRKHSAAMSNAYFSEMLSDYRQCQLAFDSFFDEYEDHLGTSRNLRFVARRALAKRAFVHGVGLLRRGRFKDGFRLVRGSMDMDHRLRYIPPIWHLVKVPGPEGRKWARSTIKEATARLLKHGDSAC